MWQIIGWIIWGIVALLAVWGIFDNRNKVKSGQEFNFGIGMVFFFLWIIAVLFLVFDWNKLHILWLLPVMLFPIPFFVIDKIPIISPFFTFITEIFWAMALIGVKIEPSEENENREEESDKKESQAMKHDFQKRYKKFCEINRELILKMMEHMPEFVMMKAAKDLHLTGPRGIILFDTEAEKCFLGDRCLYDIPWNGRNVVAHFMESEDYQQLEEDEKAVVQGMTQAYYSLFEVLSTNPSVGRLEFDDLLKQGRYTVTDFNLSRTAYPGDLLATRIRPAGDIYTTTGAVCPFRNEHKQNLLNGLAPKRIPGKRRPKKISPSDYSVYFFRKYKRTEGMEYVVVDEKDRWL